MNVSPGCSLDVAVDGPDSTNCGAATTVKVAAVVTVPLAESATVITPAPAAAKKLAGRVAVKLVALTTVEENRRAVQQHGVSACEVGSGKRYCRRCTSDNTDGWRKTGQRRDGRCHNKRP